MLKTTGYLLALLVPLAAAAAPLAAVSPDAGVAQLVRAADLIVAGRCQSAESAWDDAHRLIVTTLRFQPTRAFKGSAGTSVTVKVLGGQVGDIGMTASHSATMAAGEEAVLFLQRSQFGPYFVVAGGAEGKLPVHTDLTSGQRRIRGALSLDEFSHWVDQALQP